MTDRITTIEIEMRPEKVAEIAQEWALETKFFLHEKTERRVIYRYDRHISTTSWVSLENLGIKVKLSAWVAPKGLRPDENGSFWKGQKIPIPNGLAVGPLGRFKKHYTKLLKMMKNASNDPSIFSETQKANPPVLSKESFAKGLAVPSVIILLYGALSIFNGMNLIDKQMFPDLVKLSIQGGVVDIVVGILFFACSRLLKNGKASSIWLYGVTVLLTVIHDLIIGAKFPFFPILFGVWIMNQMFVLKKQGQLV